MRTFKSGIYVIENTVNGKRYVGSATDLEHRLRFHRRSLRNGSGINPYLQNAWNKYGKDAFVFRAIMYCGKDDLVTLEQVAMDLKSEYNLCKFATSSLGVKHSPETCAKMSRAGKGRKQTPEHIAAKAEAQIGREYSPETIAKMSASAKGRKLSAETKAKISEAGKGKVPWNKGLVGAYSHTPEVRAKISAANKGKPKTAEAKANMSAASKARYA